MTGGVNIHDVTKIEFGELWHFPVTESYGGPAFWSRRVKVVTEDGSTFELSLLGDTDEFLMTEAEKKEAADRLGAVEVAMAEQAEAEQANALAVA